MTKAAEKIAVVITDAQTGSTKTTYRNGVVYKKRNGIEWAHYGKGYEQVTRADDGTATISVTSGALPLPTTPPNETVA